MKAVDALSNGEKVEPKKLVNFTLITSENVDKFLK